MKPPRIRTGKAKPIKRYVKPTKPQAVKPSRSQLAKVARARAGGVIF